MNDKQAPQVHVAPSPHVGSNVLTTQRIMIDVIFALTPLIIASIIIFRWFAVKQIGICVISAIIFEKLFTLARRRKSTLDDFSAVVTGIILALSLPWSAPSYVGVIASGIAIGLGKVVFGGLGQNIFNPAMVGRAFVMISFPMSLGAAAYAKAGQSIEILSQATPLTAFRGNIVEGLMPLFIGNVNGSLGETSAIACLIGGIYLCIRRAASWEIPVGVLSAVLVIAGLANILNPESGFTVLHHILSGALLFGAFFIATDPVTSPLTPKGKFIFGLGVGIFIMVLRLFSGYPEGVMFAVLLMNAVTPLINRATIPQPLGGVKKG